MSNILTIGSTGNLARSNFLTVLATAFTSTVPIEISTGTPLARTGDLRFSNNKFGKTRDHTDAFDIQMFGVNASDQFLVGDGANANTILLGNTLFLRPGGTNDAMTINTTVIQLAQPIVGDPVYSSPYGVHGTTSIAFPANADYTVAAAEYALDILKFNVGAWTSGHSVVFPLPSTNPRAYKKTIWNNTNFSITVTHGVGAAPVLPPNGRAEFWFDTTNVRYASTGIVSTNFVYQPGGTGGNGIFTTWDSLVSAVASVCGERWIMVDSSLSAAGALGLPAALVPAGTWDFNPAGIFGHVHLTAKTGTSLLQTTIGAAVAIRGVSEIHDLFVDNHSSLDLFTCSSAGNAFVASGLATLHQDVGATAAFLKADVAGGRLFLKDFAGVQTFTGGTNALQETVGPFILFILDRGNFGTNQYLLTAGGSTVVQAPGSTYAAQAGAATVPQGGIQKGTTTLVAGVSPAITACIAATSSIQFNLKTPTGDALTIKYGALATDRVNGATGSFKISALSNVGGGALNVADTSVLDWEVVN